MESEQDKERNGQDRDKDKNNERVVPGDPPIIVGGGGSTWIWIRKDANIQFFDPAFIPNTVTPPDPETKPTHENLYYLMHLGNLTLTDTHFRNGEGNMPGDHNIPNSQNGKRKHRTYFNGTFE